MAVQLPWGPLHRLLFVFRGAAVMRICGRAALKLHVRHNDTAKFLDRKQGDA
jgi:hypothetical protein